MAYKDPLHKRECRQRINLNYAENDAIEALARVHGKQTATYLHEIIRAHLEEFQTGDSTKLQQSA